MVDEFYGRITARSKETQDLYDSHQAALRLEYGDSTPCPFCDLGRRKVIKELDTMMILRNNFPYEVFDGRGVKEHLMIVPKRHIADFASITQDERVEYWRLQSEYHAKGYSSMTRSAIDTKRSVPTHLHTHLFFYFTD